MCSVQLNHTDIFPQKGDIDINIPQVFGDKEAWAPRIDKGIDALIESINNGLGVMPPRGACPDCSDED